MFALQRSVADNCLRGKAAEEKVKWRRKENIRHKWHASEVLPWSQSISGNTHRIRRPVYISLRKLLSVIVSYAPPLLLTVITWQYYTCIYKWGYGTGVIYIYIYITVCIIFFIDKLWSWTGTGGFQFFPDLYFLWRIPGGNLLR